MKIGIPVEEKELNTPVCQSFGRTPLFLVFDTETNDFIMLDNSAAASQGGAGIQAAQMLSDNDVEVLITFRCGENAVEVLDAAGIKIFKAQNGTVQENLESYTNGTLKLLSEVHSGQNKGQ